MGCRAGGGANRETFAGGTSCDTCSGVIGDCQWGTTASAVCPAASPAPVRPIPQAGRDQLGLPGIRFGEQVPDLGLRRRLPQKTAEVVVFEVTGDGFESPQVVAGAIGG